MKWKNLVPILILGVLLSSLPVAAAATRPVSIGANVQQPAYPDLARNANIGWIRMTLRWDQVNPSPGVWNFGGVDGEVNVARAQGLQILAVLSYVPEWLGGGPNRNRPPMQTTEWEEFVRRTAQRYRGRIAAYEIWNEPDFGDGVGMGIGWARPISQPPTYADFLRAAAIQIRTHAPGTLVAGPAFGSRGTSRRADILRQLESTNYPNGNASDFLDVFTTHANIAGTEGPITARNYLGGGCACSLNSCGGSLGDLCVFNPRNKNKPIWITEFGWKSGEVGQGTQREYVCKFLKMMTGAYRSGYLGNYNIQRAFIYKLVDYNTGQSDGLYNTSRNPKRAVAEYLDYLPFPAAQSPSATAEAGPTCFGPGSGGGGGGGGGECNEPDCGPDIQIPRQSGSGEPTDAIPLPPDGEHQP